MHIEASHFLYFYKYYYPELFTNKKVLDVGAGDINGNNKHLFKNCEYNANDVVNASNVTIVSETKNLKFDDEYFDIIISSECFEHDPDYKESILNIIRMLKKDGLFIFTCASDGRPEHGTLNNSPSSSYATINKLDNFKNYYKNLNIDHLKEFLDLDEIFSNWLSFYNKKSKDLYFVGLKRGLINDFKFIDYLPDHNFVMW